MRRFLYRRSTWRGTYADLWTVPHAISGAMLAFFALRFGATFAESFWMALCVGIGWEFAERITSLSKTEAYTNSLTDIVAAQAGFLGGWWLFSRADEYAAGIVAAALVLAFCVICVLGYRAFKYYG